ncbi:MAG: PaaI family thioesterase [Clostridia bacterium]|nr:PaaI family thioesterase [Clostridia bacterium]
MKSVEELKEFFKRDRFVAACGIEIVSVDEEKAILRAKVEDAHLNANDCVQGGMLFTMCDFAMAVLSNALHPVTVTSVATVTYLAPCKDTEYIYAESREVARHRHNCVHEVKITTDDGVIVCTAQVNGFIKEQIIR